MRALHPDLARTDRPLQHFGSYDLLVVRPVYIAGHLPALLRNCGREMRPLRGADEAGGHEREPVRRSPTARADRTRALAGDVAEGAPERAQALPAGAERDLGDGQVG